MFNHNQSFASEIVDFLKKIEDQFKEITFYERIATFFRVLELDYV